MFTKTFPGGIHPEYNKEITSLKPIEEAPLPKSVVIPLLQHTGAPCQPLVKVGDLVKVGQKIGDSDKFISAPVHASISGTVKTVEPRMNFLGAMVPSVVIESDGKDEKFEGVKPYPDLDSLSSEDIIKAVREAGITGMGGAAFPTHVKLSPPKEKKIDHLLINGAECEPFLTCDHRIMLEETNHLLYGIKALKKALNVKKASVVVEDNKKDAIQKLKLTLGKEAQVIEVETKYPQGGEKQLIKAVSNKEVPSGGLPMDVGFVVVNVGTIIQIAKTLRSGLPLYERVVTVTGKSLKESKNLMVRIGTSFGSLIEYCGGVTKGEIQKVVSGGPMMGIAVPSLEVSVVKGTSGILVFIDEEVLKDVPEACLRCAKCVDVCPVGLIPGIIADYAEKGDWDSAEKMGAMDCIECGACAYECVSKRNIVQLIKQAKAEILERRKKKNK